MGSKKVLRQWKARISLVVLLGLVLSFLPLLLYSAFAPNSTALTLTLPSPMPAAYWRFDEGSGSKAASHKNLQPLLVPSGDKTTEARVLEAYGELPLLFIPNEGQVDAQVKYYARAPGQSIYFVPGGVVFDLFRRSQSSGRSSGAAHTPEDTPGPTMERLTFSLDFVGASPGPVVEAKDRDEAVVNYFIGNDPNQWHSSIPSYREIVYREIYPNMDLRLYSNKGSLSYDFIVKPGGNVSDIRLAYAGIDRLRLDSGELVVQTAFGDMKQLRPYVYQQIDGEQMEIRGAFRLLDSHTYGFEVSPYSSDYPLVIDPSLVYSTYLGGTDQDSGRDIAVDAQGNAYVTGHTESTNFPTQYPFQGTKAGYRDAFVTKLSASGSAVVYSTYLGGTHDDEGVDIAVDVQGSAYVTGDTFSTNFPTQYPFQGTKAGYRDSFVTKLSPNGSALVYSTYLGGTAWDSGYGIAVDLRGSAYVTGYTGSPDFPTRNPFQGTNAGYSDAFVTKLSASGSALVYSTYLGGSGNDYGFGIAVDARGSAYVTGGTGSTNFPTLNSFQGTFAGGRDAFVTRLSPSGDALVYSTYLGGTAWDMGDGIALDGQGSAHVTGWTDSTNFPTRNPFQGTKVGDLDAFVSKLSSSGSALVYSTYLGGTDQDSGLGIAIDGQGDAYVTGSTDSTNFPTQNAFQRTNAGNRDAFVSKLSPSGSALVFSTYLGGTSEDWGYSIAVDARGNAYVTGWTDSTNFPTRNPFQGTKAGNIDTFVTKIGTLPDTTPPAAVTGLHGVDMTGSGFVYPAGRAGPYAYEGWLAGGPGMPPYQEGYYHLGQDMEGKVGDSVYAVADGEIVYLSASGWGAGNYGLLIKHRLGTGEEFLALYGRVIPNRAVLRYIFSEANSTSSSGRVIPNRPDLKYTASGVVDPPVPVGAGEAFATIGAYDSIPHLHFGIHPGAAIPPSPWEKMPLDQWPETNGFVDPLGWITTRTPLSPLDPSSSIMLAWPAPGDDGNAGTATAYDLRYSTSVITEATWASATRAIGEPAPQRAGSVETFVVKGLSPATTYYFALKTADEVPNWSALSNVTAGTILEATTHGSPSSNPNPPSQKSR